MACGSVGSASVKLPTSWDSGNIREVMRNAE